MRHVYKYYRHVIWGHGENLSENRTQILSFRQYLAKSPILPDPNTPAEVYGRYKKRGQGHLSKQKAGSSRTERKKERLVNRPNKFGVCFILFLCFVSFLKAIMRLVYTRLFLFYLFIYLFYFILFYFFFFITITSRISNYTFDRIVLRNSIDDRFETTSVHKRDETCKDETVLSYVEYP